MFPNLGNQTNDHQFYNQKSMLPPHHPYAAYHQQQSLQHPYNPSMMPLSMNFQQFIQHSRQFQSNDIQTSNVPIPASSTNNKTTLMKPEDLNLIKEIKDKEKT